VVLLSFEDTVRHFMVALYVEVILNGVKKTNIWSGFIVERKGQWLLVTCGHTGEDLDKAFNEAGAELKRFGLIEFTSAPRVAGVPDLVHLPREHRGGYIYKDGADFGYIVLDFLTVELLRKTGVRPIPENAVAPGMGDFDAYHLAGVPNEGVVPQTPQVDATMALESLAVACVVLPLEYLGIDKRDKVGRLKFKVNLEDVTIAGKPLQSIVGMSGGPIFATKPVKDKGGIFILGVQQSWNPDKHILYANPVAPLIATLVQAAQLG